jgi:hypothetical protein
LGVVGEVEVGEFGEEAEGAVEGSGRCLRAFGRVLGDVGSDRAVGEVGAVEVVAADGADVELAPEGEGVGAAVDDGTGDAGGGDGGADGVGEQFVGGPGGRRGGATVGAVEADDGVEVDGAAPLVLGDLGERGPSVLAEGALGEPGALGDLAAQVNGEAPPEGSGMGVPEDAAS